MHWFIGKVIAYLIRKAVVIEIKESIVLIEEVIVKVMREVAERQEIELSDSLRDDMVLLDSGLDSLSFAIMVSELESNLGYDPFVLVDTPVYPLTLGEFTEIYKKYSSHRTDQ